MRCLSLAARLAIGVAVFAALGLTASRTFAQVLANQAGVVINADGVLTLKMYSDPTGTLLRERIAAARATLDPKVTAQSKIRKISLNRLEAAILGAKACPPTR